MNAEIEKVVNANSDWLRAPFPWFGGKAAVGGLVWDWFGDVPNYVEPCFGSGAVLFARPVGHSGYCETINDKDGYVANFWRAIQHDPAAVAAYADAPVNENDLHARHSWLVAQKEQFVPKLEGDPDFYDAKIAGWWCWGICCWIGGGFCSGNGPWHVVEGKLVHRGDKGQGVTRSRIQLRHQGQGVNRKRIVITDDGVGCNRLSGGIEAWFGALAVRLRRVRVCCGDWRRLTSPTVTTKQGLTGVFLDPPYGVADRADVYNEECRQVSGDVRDWALERGGDPLMRIALCGYEGEHEMPGDWACVAWKARGGYGSRSRNGNDNANRERIWFSPHCLRPMSLFEG